MQLLDEVSSAPLTMIVAPAGTGKTALAAAWTAESDAQIVWFSLEEGDRDACSFWTGLLAALEDVAPGCSRAASSYLRQPGARLPEVVGAVLDELESAPRPTSFVVIDDLHLADTEAVGASLSLLVRYLPEWLHVIAISRHELEMPLDRLRSLGRLGEIRFAELRFSDEEAREMLTRLSPDLSDAEIEAITERAGGWATGLQLASITTRSRRAQLVLDGPLFRDRLLVDDYVLREVLAGEPAELVDVLLDVAPVERIPPELACELAGRSDAEALLRQAEAHSLFVARIAPEGWYTIHALIRGALVAELARRSQARLAELHRIAAQWFEQVGEVRAALGHWLSAGRPRDALRLLADANADLYDAGLEATISSTLAAIPDDVVHTDLSAMLDSAWAHLFVARRRFLDLVEHMSFRVGADDVGDVVERARLAMLRSIAATIDGGWDDGESLAREAIALLGDQWPQDRVGRFAWNMVARCVALSERWDDEADEVTAARRAVGVAAERRLAYEGTRALGLALAGRPVDALRTTAGVRRAADIVNRGVLRAELALADAIAHRELGDRRRAVPELHELAETRSEAMLFCQLYAVVELSHARLDEGDVEGARSEFARAEELIATESFGPGGRTWLGRLGVLLAIADDDLRTAHEWVETIADPFWRDTSTARIHLAANDRAAANDALDALVPRCVRHEVVATLLRARAADEQEESVKLAAAAVEAASGNGLLQTVASEGPLAVELVELASWRPPADWMDRLRRAAAEGQRRWPLFPLTLSEPLTRRERDVLRFLPSRLTVREIADELFISGNTLKFHLKLIYRKLGVSSRAEAAEIARRMADHLQDP